MNNQQAFDKMVTHLFTQKEKALSPGGGCRYLAFDGLKCAVGCLIPEEEYSTSIEGKRVLRIAEIIPALKGLSIDMLSNVQAIHDNRPTHVWFNSLRDVCCRFKLDDTVLLTFQEVHIP